MELRRGSLQLHGHGFASEAGRGGGVGGMNRADVTCGKAGRARGGRVPCGPWWQSREGHRGPREAGCPPQAGAQRRADRAWMSNQLPVPRCVAGLAGGDPGPPAAAPWEATVPGLGAGSFRAGLSVQDSRTSQEGPTHGAAWWAWHQELAWLTARPACRPASPSGPCWGHAAHVATVCLACARLGGPDRVWCSHPGAGGTHGHEPQAGQASHSQVWC